MGVTWMIVNLDKKEQIRIGRLGESIFEKIGSRLIDEINGWRWKSLKGLMDERRISYKRNIRSLGSLELPTEIIDMIFSFIDKAQTAFRLGSTNTHLMLIGERHIHGLMGTPKWGGDRILCVHDSSIDDESYKDIDLGEDYAKYLVDTAQEEYNSDDDSDLDGPNLRNIFGYARRGFRKPTSKWWSKGCSYEVRNRLEDEDPLLRDYKLWMVAYELRIPDPPIQKAQIVWNLSKRLYISHRAIPKDVPDMLKGNADYEQEILGLAVLFQICRASSPCHGNLAYYGRQGHRSLHKGPWAGDRFEVTDENILESRLKEEGKKWKNVSGRVIGLCLKVLRADRE